MIMNYFRTIIVLLVVALSIHSCGTEPKKQLFKYTYVETIDDLDVFTGNYYSETKEPEVIVAEDDSAAYYKAYERFMISCAVNDMVDNKYTIPKSFALTSADGRSVAVQLSRATLDGIRKSVYQTVFDDEPEMLENFETSIDSAKIAELKPYFNMNKDEFDPRGITWIMPKNAPSSLKTNHIYCYFMQEGDVVKNFRLKIQYHAYDWLFVKKYQFAIDGNAYEYVPADPERDHGSGHIWEWSDDVISLSDYKLIKALAEADSAKIKYIGSQYHDIKTIPSDQIESIRRTVELYRVMGGSF